MALTATEENVILREWAPLTDLFQKLPMKTNNSFFNSDLKLTCIDVITEYIALGTSTGVVYCYDRKRKDIQRLRCENEKSPITKIKIISTVDFMLACGNAEGNINIFQIPKRPPDSLPDSLKPKNKQVERYTVSEMHKGPISTLEWSKNGMKLFSGDANGLVVLTEIDFYMHLCKSMEIINEAYEVVQISYHQQNLLVSTTYRSIVCQKHDKWKVCQVGKKERKVLGQFGGIFFQNGLKPTDVVVYCSRPGLRLWVSDIKGSVQQTLLFKDILNQQFPEVPVLNPLPSTLKRMKPNKEACFGTVLPFFEDLLVTFNNNVVYILNPKEMKILATVSHLRGVLDVAVNKDEIFILEGERSVIRVAFMPESTITQKNSLIGANPNVFQPLHSIKDITSKIQASSIMPAIATSIDAIRSPGDLTSELNAEEAKETVKDILMNKYKSCEQTYTDKVYESYRKMETFNKISEQEFDDIILYKHTKTKKSSDMSASMCSSISSNSSDDREANVTKPTAMDVSMVDIRPDLRSPDSIQIDIEEKEKKLADLLNFDKLKIDLSLLDKNESANICEKTEETEKHETQEKSVNICDKKAYKKPESSSKRNIPNNELVKKKQTIEEIQNLNALIQKCDKEVNGETDDIPVCRMIPDNWKVYQLSLKKESQEPPDDSLDDWEIV